MTKTREQIDAELKELDDVWPDKATLDAYLKAHIESDEKFEELASASGLHLWFNYRDKHDVCKWCGVVRRSDDKNKPCKGKVKLGFK